MIKRQRPIPSSTSRQRGTAALELVLCFPLLLTIFFGTVEISRFFLAIQKTEKTVDLITDVVARSDSNYASETLSAANMSALLSSVSEMMQPFPVGANGVVIITDVTQPADITQPAVVNWQYCGGGTLSHASAIGTANANAAIKNSALLPPGVVLNAGEEVVIGEIYYNFSPITIQGMIGSIQLSRMAFHIPRVGSVSPFVSRCT